MDLKTDIKFDIIGSSIRKVVGVFSRKSSIIIMNTCYLGLKKKNGMQQAAHDYEICA